MAEIFLWSRQYARASLFTITPPKSLGSNCEVSQQVWYSYKPTGCRLIRAWEPVNSCDWPRERLSGSPLALCEIQDGWMGILTRVFPNSGKYRQALKPVDQHSFCTKRERTAPVGSGN
jgi:hypothetical protein